MKEYVAKSVAEKLEEDADVLDTRIEEDRTTDEAVRVTAIVPNKHALKRVKATLYQYPIYVGLEVRDD